MPHGKAFFDWKIGVTITERIHAGSQWKNLDPIFLSGGDREFLAVLLGLGLSGTSG
jgi:hypothetical protein